MRWCDNISKKCLCSPESEEDGRRGGHLDCGFGSSQRMLDFMERNDGVNTFFL